MKIHEMFQCALKDVKFNDINRYIDSGMELNNKRFKTKTFLGFLILTFRTESNDRAFLFCLCTQTSDPGLLKGGQQRL